MDMSVETDEVGKTIAWHVNGIWLRNITYSGVFCFER